MRRLYGTAFVRGYGEQGKGILNVRSDYYTHPRFIKKYEKAGQLAGFTTSHQGASPEARSRQIMLLPPVEFCGIPDSHVAEYGALRTHRIRGHPR